MSAPRIRMLAPLRGREFRLFWAGQSVSMVGDGMFTVALAWQTLQISDRPGALALVFLARSIPNVLLLILGGALTDRLPRRRLLILSDAGRMAASSTIAILGATGAIQMWHLIALGAAFGTANAFFSPVFTAIVPDLVEPKDLAQANALSSTSRLLGVSLIGPAIGGILIAGAGAAWAFAADGASFFVAVVAALAMRAGRSRPARQQDGMRHEILEGFRFTRSQPWLWVTLLSASVGNVSFSLYVALVPLVVTKSLGGGAGMLAAFYVASGVGGGIAALVAGQRGIPRRRVLAMYAAWALAGLGAAGVGAVPVVAVAVALSGIVGFGMEYGNVMWTTLMQDLVPSAMLGRVSAFDWVLSIGLTPVAFGVAGPLAGVLGAPAVVILAGSLAVVADVAAVTRPGVRDPETASAAGGGATA